MDESKKIPYEISKYSSYSTSYLPENIREDCPGNQTSRWSSNTNSPPQFLVLRLQRPAVITHIKFGKHEKTHVCNLKKFRVYGGLSEDRLEPLFDGGLKNDSVPETFELRHAHSSCTGAGTGTAAGELMPLQYVKIVPLLSWGASFNFSIWYVELLGRDDPFYVRDALRDYHMMRELELVRLCLKHFRQQGYAQAFRALQAETGVRLEEARMTQLYEALVLRGDFAGAEQMLHGIVDDGLVDRHLAQLEYKAIWQQQQPQLGIQADTTGSPHSAQPLPRNSPPTPPSNRTDRSPCSPKQGRHQQLPHRSVVVDNNNQLQQPTIAGDRRPGMRGGHQLVVDSELGIMYLFGGWDGFTDLSDLWRYEMSSGQWTRLHGRAEQRGGPGPRSCHKMLFDPVNKTIFVFGRYLDSGSRHPENMNSDFYMYDTRTDNWLQICEDTATVGGPQLIFDHQMCIDAAKQTIYVFGGRILTVHQPGDIEPPPSGGGPNVQYSGLFAYHIATNTWHELLVDCEHLTAANPDVLSIKSRVTHSMLFHERHRRLYIFGGQRNKEYTPEFLAYDVDAQRLSVVDTANASADCGSMPQSGFTQRATIDTERDEIYVLSSLSKEKERRDLNLNSFWIFSLRTSTWLCIYRSDHSAEQCFTKAQSTCTEPCPRYAHQLVYDQRRQLHYLFGGNPGKNQLPQLRLDDFWVLRLQKPSRGELLRQTVFALRRLHYEEIARADPLRAVHFLQTRLSECIDHSDAQQLHDFHKLTALLFRNSRQPADGSKSGSGGAGVAVAGPQHKSTGSTSSSISSGVHHMDMATDSTDSEMSMSPLPSPAPPAATAAAGGAEQMALKERRAAAEALLERFDGSAVQQRRSLLYNRIVSMLPPEMAQPSGLLADALGTMDA